MLNARIVSAEAFEQSEDWIECQWDRLIYSFELSFATYFLQNQKGSGQEDPTEPTKNGFEYFSCDQSYMVFGWFGKVFLPQTFLVFYLYILGCGSPCIHQ